MLNQDTPAAQRIVNSAGFWSWWWRPAQAVSGEDGSGLSLLSRRGQQSLDEMTVPGFKDVVDWSWADLAELSVDQWLQCAEFFSYILISQPAPVSDRLVGVSPADQRWAMSISSIQPFPRTLNWSGPGGVSNQLMAMAEVLYWVKIDFPCLLNRLLREFVPADRLVLVDLTSQNHSVSYNLNGSFSRRVRRSWLLAKQKMENQSGVC